jgi:hypothetical protein
MSHAAGQSGSLAGLKQFSKVPAKEKTLSKHESRQLDETRVGRRQASLWRGKNENRNDKSTKKGT